MKDYNTQSADDLGLPPGYVTTGQGLALSPEADDESNVGSWLCSTLRVIGAGSRADSTGWGRVVELVDPAGRSHRINVANGTSSSALAKLLQSYDLCLNTCMPRVDRHLARLVWEWECDANYLFVDRFGWVDSDCSTFVLAPDHTIGPKPVFFTGGQGSFQRRQVSGTLDTWKATVAARCVGNPILTCAVSLAFAGPFLEFLNMDGFSVHLRGRSSSGKTTALRVANSVWNAPDGIQTWRTTSNGLEAVAASANGTLLPLDELGQVTASEAGEAAYMLGNGRGKRRALANGERAQTLEWKLVALSTGEVSLSAKMAKAGNRAKAGQEARFIDIQADGRSYGVFDDLHGAKDGAELSRELTIATAANFGTAGRALIARLVSFDEDTRNKINVFITNRERQLLETVAYPLDGPSRRVCRSLALAGAAGDIASAFKITGWPSGAASRAIGQIFHEWLDSRAQPLSDLVWEIMDFINRHADKLQALGGAEVSERVGYGDGAFYYLSRAAWSRIFTEEDGKTAARLLSKHEILLKDGAHYAPKMSRQVPGRERHYKLSIKGLQQFAPEAASGSKPPS